MNKPFKIEGLDHVAILAQDPEASVKWYKEVLGLKEYRVPEWKEFPIFMLAGKTGVAIFPNRNKITGKDKIDHFAFNVDHENFVRAQKNLSSMSIHFHFSDHKYFHSIYFKDPDNNTVELTTLVVPENEFYDNLGG